MLGDRLAGARAAPVEADTLVMAESDATASMLAGDGAALLEKLPPMPPPNLSAMRREAAIGCTVVLSVVGGCIAVGHVAAHLLDNPLGVGFLGMIYAQAAAALLCLLGIMFGDPGVVHASRRRDCHFTGTPVSSILKRLRKGEGGAAE